ncbi:Thiol peroxidase, Bcp-type [Minicystis rosea]|nr:Thiol peroxidase, Bcp-type [Minicystis rosea]
MPVPRLAPRSLTAVLALASAALLPSAAEAFSPYLVVPDPAVAEASPAYRYANMTDNDAFAELDRRNILYQKLDPVPGVRAPIRITGRLHGVYVHSSLPPDQRVTSIFEILDARLALALDDFCAVLERHDIDEVVHFTMYRPNVAAPSHGPPDEQAHAPSGKPLGARPRPEAPFTKTKVQPHTSLGKGTLDAPKAPAHAPLTAKQKNDDGKPEPVKKAALPAKPPAAPAKAASVPAKAPAVPAKAASVPAKPPAVPAKAASVPAKAPALPAHAAPPVKTVAAPARAGGTLGVKRVAKRDVESSGLHQTTWAAPGTRHPAGLAIDVGLLRKRDGHWLNVARDFHGRIGAKTCGEGAPMPDNADAKELRALVCESADLGVFTYVLTPDYNAAHADHFHMEIRSGVKWFLYH